MKTPVLILLLAFVGMQPLWSQSYYPFPDTNATWCDERYDNGWPYTNYYYYFYKTNGKSSINDTVYTIISDNYDQVRCYLREENKKVFCRFTPADSEFILYNFDVEIGDTIVLQQCYGESFDAYVEGIDSVLIGEQYHRRYFIQCWEWLSFYFTEGLGSDAGLMYCDLPWVDFYGNLYCFSLNDTIYELNGSGSKDAGSCWQYIGIPESNEGRIKIYPNPATDYISISYDQDCQMELVDITGRQCRQSNSNIMNVKDLEQGVYFLRIYSNTRRLLHQSKILKLNKP